MSLPLYRPFKSVLIANRGEIAVRIVKEAQSQRLRAIAVYSDADRGSRTVSEADMAAFIGPSPAQDSYLNVERILAAAKTTGAEAIHPGYGFLSENAGFAQAVIDAGIVWIGPSPSAIRAMGDKGAAKQIARKVDVPVIPGYDGDDQSDTRLLVQAREIGWPVLIKAANGGGGRGQRRVTRESEFADALAAARRESLLAFASDKVILERALDDVRHVEVQVFGDAHGNMLHFGERDCSVQRRNQKILEEAPAASVSPELRLRMGENAVRLARAVDYTSAGTVEFLLNRDGKFYFLEMNTRIQVEHPVTEEVTGTNLIRMQFEVAMGKPIDQIQTELRGHAIEVRLCAEDPADGFAPQSGHIEEIYCNGEVRADSIEAGGNPASGHYDSLLVKLIARGATRDEARRKLIDGLEQTQVVGIRTNRNFLVDLLQRDALVAGAVDVGWLTLEPTYTENNLDSPLAEIAALFLASGARAAWRSTGANRTIVILRERALTRTFAIENGCLGGRRIDDRLATKWNGALRIELKGSAAREDVFVYQQGPRIHVHFRGRDALFEDVTYAPAEPKNAGGDGAIRAPMAGKIVRVNVEPGAQVVKGQVLVILEAMKMEHEIVARAPGTVATVAAKQGDQVAARQVLATLTV